MKQIPLDFIIDTEESSFNIGFYTYCVKLIDTADNEVIASCSFYECEDEHMSIEITSIESLCQQNEAHKLFSQYMKSLRDENKKSIYITDVTVNELYRSNKTGIKHNFGKIVFSHALKIMKENKYHQLYLHAYPLDNDTLIEPLTTFYEKFGFKSIAKDDIGEEYESTYMGMENLNSIKLPKVYKEFILEKKVGFQKKEKKKTHSFDIFS